MVCVVISPEARQLAQLAVTEREVRELMQGLWGTAPVDWAHEIQHVLMRREAAASNPLAAVLPRLYQPTPLALQPVKRSSSILDQFLLDYEVKGEGCD